MNNVINTTLEEQLILLGKDLTIIRAVYSGMERGKRGISGEHLYSHFFAEDHVGLTDVTKPTEMEALWAFKLDSFVPQGLNHKDFM